LPPTRSARHCEMLKILGVALFSYVAISFATVKIYATDRVWGRT
jgi:hypothetical protein